MASVPDGKYITVVQRVEVVASSSGVPMIRWTLLITGPQHTNRLLWKNHAVGNNTLKYIKADLQLCGLYLDAFSELPEHLDKLIGMELEVTKRTKNGYENIYFNRLIGGPTQVELPF
jgi:hypothetical protein